jgi:hypothetical protein
MRTFLVAIAIFGLLAVAVKAADDDTAPVAGSLPDNARNHKVYLFMLKKNGLSIRKEAKDFCGDLGYGVPVYWDRANDEKKREDNSAIQGELNWVICEYPRSQ